MSAKPEVDDADEFESEVDEAYRIGGPSEADWALRKLRYYQQRAEEVKALHDSEVQRFHEWATDETAKVQPGIDRFTGLLRTWHMQVLAGDPKRKSLSYPNGKLTSRAGATVPVFDDLEAFLAAAPDELMRIKREPAKSAITKHIKETGEVLPGVHLEETERTFKIEVSETAIPEEESK